MAGVLERPVPMSSTTDLSSLPLPAEPIAVDTSHIEEIFEIEHTIQAVQKYERIALQFPDELLIHAVPVYQAIRRRLDEHQELYVLADTTFGSCCVDEIAAEHVNADIVVHYGHSCLSPTQRLPVLYVFLKQPLSAEPVSDAWDRFCQDNPLALQGRTRAVLKYDVAYTWKIDEVASRLREKLSIPLVYTLPQPLCESKDKGKGKADDEAHSIGNEDVVVYIGKPSLALTHLIMLHGSLPIVAYDPESTCFDLASAKSNRLLMRRYAAIQKARDADVVGILVGTLGIASYLPLIDRLRSVLRAHRKKTYTIAVGKPTPSKLANYQEIECFVLVACPENSLLLTSPDEGKQYLRPIVTPWELEVALGSGHKKWEDGWRIGWDAAEEDTEANDAPSSDGEDHDVQFSSVTGQLRTVRRYDANKNTQALTDAVESMSLEVRSDQNRQIASLLGSAAGEHIRSRTYQGLDPRFGQDAPARMEQGRSGIASGYQSELGP